LQGELRADSTALLGDFQLTDEQALHLKVYTDAPDKPALYLLAGKGSGTNGFMRRAGEGRIYSVNLHLQSTAGLTSGTPDQAPSAKPWLDLRIQNVPKEQVSAVELHSPTRDLQFTTQPAAPAGGTEAASPPPAPAWKLVAPELPYSVKPDAVESLVTALRTLQGDDVVDPAKTPEYGLDTPPYQATLTVQPGGQEARQATVSLGNEVPAKSGSRYARIGDTGPVYIVPQWTVQRLFPTLGTLLDVRILQVPQEEVARLTLQEEGESWSLERHAPEASTAGNPAESTATWQFVGNPDATVDAAAVTSLLGATAQLNADDLPANLPSQTGLDRPRLRVILTLRDGRTERLLLGQAVEQDSKGYYASRGDGAEVFIVPTITNQTLTDAVAKLKPGSASTAKAPAKP